MAEADQPEPYTASQTGFMPALMTASWVIRMMAAVQPFLSGAISKTVNVPQDATVEDMERAYIEGWKMGLKALAVYRDGSKRTQPLNTGASASDSTQPGVVAKSARRKLPEERRALTHKFSVAGHDGYITVGLFEDGTPGEIFVVMAKEGSTISGLMDSFATAISLALQYGVPVQVLIEKFAHTRFEPSGFTQNKKIPMAKSIMDYIFRWLAIHFCDVETQRRYGIQVENGEVATLASAPVHAAPVAATTVGATKAQEGGLRLAPIAKDDAPTCSDCGSIMVRNGACYKCLNCGITSGCS